MGTTQEVERLCMDCRNKVTVIAPTEYLEKFGSNYARYVRCEKCDAISTLGSV